MKLYELTSFYAELQERVEDGDHEAVVDTLEALEDAIEEKVDSIYRIYRNLQADINALKEEEKRLKGKRQRLEASQDHLVGYVEGQLMAARIDKVKTSIGTVGFRKAPASVEIINEDQFIDVYPDLVEYEPKINKAGLKDRIKQNNGGKLPQKEVIGAGFVFRNNKKTLQFR